jgi:hypothetical protein
MLYVLSIPLVKNNPTIFYQQKTTALFLVILFLAFRGFVSTDWINYFQLYKVSPSLFDGFDSLIRFMSVGKYAGMEHGFLVYTIICKTISSNYFLLQIMSTVIDIVILYHFFKLYTPNNIILGLIFFILFGGLISEINLLRNSKSIAIFLISIKYIEKRKLFQFLALNIFGSLFHISAVLYIPLYFVINRQYPKKIILILFLLGNAMFLLSISWMRGILLTLSSIYDSRLSVLIQNYMSSPLYSRAFGITIGYIERTMSFLIIYIFHNKLIINRQNIIFLNCAYIYWFVYLYCSEVYIILQRMPLLFIFSYWILYPQLFYVLSKEKKKIFLIFMLVYGVLLFSTYTKESNRYENIVFGHSSYNKKKAIILQELSQWRDSKINSD